jgi:hypothetical protein
MTVLRNVAKRLPRQRYVWPEKALSLVRSTRIPKKDGAMIVQQLKAITSYPEKACWRLAERHGFRRPLCRREWSQEDFEKIVKMCEADRPVSEIADYFGVSLKTIYQKIFKSGKRAGRSGSIYTVSLIAGVLHVGRPTVKQWAAEGRLQLKTEQRGGVTIQYLEDEDFERFCRENQNYLIYDVGGRIAPRERIRFLKEFVAAADMPDDFSARGHKRERHAYARQMSMDAEDNSDEEGTDEPMNSMRVVPRLREGERPQKDYT